MATNHDTVRIKESLKVKIGEAKNVGGISSGINKNTYCMLKLDNEVIYKTSVVEKSSSPFYGEEFKGEIPRQFRFLSLCVNEAGHKHDKTLGKVTIRKEVLHKYNGKDHWLPLQHGEANCYVQGKVHLEIRFDELLNMDSDCFTSNRMSVRLVECSDLTVVNGACNPYAVVTVTYGRSKCRSDTKKSSVHKKTICPQFDQTFSFDLTNRGLNQEHNQYVIEDIFDVDISVALWHDDSRMMSDRLGSMFRGVFLGEVRVPVVQLDTRTVHKAWYFLQGRDSEVSDDRCAGSLRVNISYVADKIFLSHFYDDLRSLILSSPSIVPVSSSAVFILSDVVDNLPDAAQPVMRVFLHHRQLVPLIESLAEWEISSAVDMNTLFRGNTLVTKIVDELMKFVALPYLHSTIKYIIDQVCLDERSCEIDEAKLKEGESLDENMTVLAEYVEQTLTCIVDSALACPTVMTEVFSTLKRCTIKLFPKNAEVKYRVVSAFIFLRFFAPAILGPRLFELRMDIPNVKVQRTLTLMSKTIQGLGNLVSAKTQSLAIKEAYMVPIFQMFTDARHIAAIRMYLDIISTVRLNNLTSVDSSITLKEGLLIKRAQGRKLFGVKNFKRRYFCLTNQALFYCQNKGDAHLCDIPLADILAVEKVHEDSFKMKYMFQVVQPRRVLYIQASNCIEEREWLELLTKICKSNKERNSQYHPAAFINGHWLCCKKTDHGAGGCTPVTQGVPLSNIHMDHIDSDREMERIHSVFLQHVDRLEMLQDECAMMEVYSGDSHTRSVHHIDDTQSFFKCVNEVLECVIRLEQEHLRYTKLVQRNTIIGSEEHPISDENKEDFLNSAAQRSLNHLSDTQNTQDELVI